MTIELSAESAIGNGDFTPYYLTSNRHGILSTCSNTGYLRSAMTWQKPIGQWKITTSADLEIQSHTDNSTIYLQQLYLEANWKWLNLQIGSRELNPMLRDFRLSSGSMVWSGNARPIPGAYLGTNGFIDFPGTRHWMQVFADGSYGYYMDSNYLEDEYAQYLIGKTGYGRSYITTHIWSHQKRIALRSNPHKPFVLTIGMEHAVQFGGESTNYIETANNGNFSPKLKDFITVLIPKSGSNAAVTGDQEFVYGNHIGNIHVMLEYQWGKANCHKIGWYVEDPFEDGSGMHKDNGWDGLWGIEYHNSNAHTWLRGIVLEYLTTVNQSGPIHWAPEDFVGQEIANVAHEATGADDYYNNYFYTGYSHFGQACGSPLLKSPAYNSDHYLRFTDTRIRAWHIGLEGEIVPLCNARHGNFGYRILCSHRRSFGTFFDPSPFIRLSTNGLFELNWSLNNWSLSASFAFDEGDLYGSNHAFDFRISHRIR